MLYRGDYDEKRNFSRMTIEAPAILRIEGDDSLYHGTAVDISATGMKVCCDTPFEVGTLLLLDVTPELAVVPPLRARVEVVRCSDNGEGRYALGLKTVEMLPADYT